MIHVPGEDHSYVLYIVHKPNFSTDCTVDTAISGYIRTLSMRYRIRKIGLQQTVLFFLLRLGGKYTTHRLNEQIYKRLHIIICLSRCSDIGPHYKCICYFDVYLWDITEMLPE